MGPHHLAFYETLVKRRMEDLDVVRRQARRRSLVGASRPAAARPPVGRVRWRLAAALVALAKRLDPDLGWARPPRTPSRA